MLGTFCVQDMGQQRYQPWSNAAGAGGVRVSVVSVYAEILVSYVLARVSDILYTGYAAATIAHHDSMLQELVAYVFGWFRRLPKFWNPPQLRFFSMFMTFCVQDMLQQLLPTMTQCCRSWWRTYVGSEIHVSVVADVAAFSDNWSGVRSDDG